MTVDVTVLLTLRGRHLHTLRWLWHANRAALPFHVIIADGDVHPAIVRVVSNRRLFPNLSYEYRQYADKSFDDFYRKCADAAAAVSTKYLMVSDNDDFPIATGIREAVQYLESHPDYVCAGGELPSFELSGRHSLLPAGVVGAVDDLNVKYSYQTRDIASPRAAERALEELTHYQTIYYHVYRTVALQTIFNDVARLGFSDLTIHEYFCAARAATLGKVRAQRAMMCYLRQRGTSSGFSYARAHDWVDHLVRSRLPEDARSMADAIAKEVAAAEGVNQAELRERVLDAYAAILRHSLAHTLVRHRFPRLARIKRSVSRVAAVRLTSRRSRISRFWKRFAASGVANHTFSEYTHEFRSVQDTLEGQDFATFVMSEAPELVTA